MQAILQQEFDSKIFSVPFYRIIHFNKKLVEEEMRFLENQNPIIIDAKTDASDNEWGLFLQKKGFRKVCVQVELEKIVETQCEQNNISCDEILNVSDDIIHKHVENFIYDRFSLDPFIPKEKRDLLYFNWIKNSFLNPSIKILNKNNDFCSFKIREQTAYIDLISVLNKGKHIGHDLINALGYYSSTSNISTIKVITEAENWNAFRFYINNGYVVSKFINCFHLVKT